MIDIVEQEKILDVISKTKILLDEMEKEVVYQKNYNKIWKKAEQTAKQKGVDAWCCGDFLTWAEKEKYSKEGKGKVWFKRRAMIIRDWMLNIYE